MGDAGLTGDASYFRGACSLAGLPRRGKGAVWSLREESGTLAVGKTGAKWRPLFGSSALGD